jgi:energy-coupling factor transporter ATP-binding protein EcfA2
LTKELAEYLAVKEPTQVRYSYDENNRKIALERGDVNEALRDAISGKDINCIIQASSKRIDLEGFKKDSDGLYFRVNKLIYIWALNPAVPNAKVDDLVRQLIVDKIGFNINSPETIKHLNQIYSTLIWTDEGDCEEVAEHDIASLGLENDAPNISVNFSILEQLPMCKALFTWLQVSDDKTHPIASLTSLLTIVSAVTARGYYTHTNASTNLFLIMIGRSGIGKNTVVKTPNKIMDQIDQKHKIIAGKVSSEGAMDDIFKVQNVAVHVIDEFGDQLGHMLSDKGGYLKAVSSKMKNLYSLSDGIYESSRYSSAGGKKRTEDPWTTSRPCYGITGLTTEKQLLMYLNDNHVSDGFLNRFVILNGEGIDPQFNHHPIYEIPDELLSHIKSIKMSTGYTSETDKGDALLVKAVTENVKYFTDNERSTLPLSLEASNFYTRFIGDADLENTDIYNFCKNDDSDTKRDIAMRWRENSLRLAVALTAYEKQDEVSFEVLQWCYTLVKNASINFIELFTAKATQTQYEELKEKAIRWFSSQNDKSKYHALSMLARSARPFTGMKSRERKELLEDLVESQVIEHKRNKVNNHETDYYRLIAS